jgi:nicotinate-nucleotide adenylyltransferase
VQEALDLDRLLLVVANDPWQKSPKRAITPAEDRFAMAQALAKEIPGAEASRMEIDRGGPSFTVMTAETLVAEAVESGQPPPLIYLVVGADLVSELGTWERSEDLKGLVTLAAVSRPPVASTSGELSGQPQSTPVPPRGWRVRWVEGPLVDVSSSTVRDVLERGGSVEDLVPAEVVHCIRRRNLYAVGR